MVGAGVLEGAEEFHLGRILDRLLAVGVTSLC